MNKRGFTLVELLLYLGVAATMVLIASELVSLLFQSRSKQRTIFEVEGQGIQVIQRVLQTVRNADGINAPAQGASATALSLDVRDDVLDPTIFDLSGGALRLREGAGAPVVLTNSRVTASALTFQNLAAAGTPGSIRITFTITYVNPTGRNEYEFAKTFTTSASRR